MGVGAHDARFSYERKKKKTFVRAPPVILRPRQLPMSPMPQAGPACELLK